MATITSLVLNLALKMPGTLPTIMPAAIPARILITSSRGAGRERKQRAVMTLAMAPAWSCPSAPMFNMPHLDPIATARPVKARGMLLLIVLARDCGVPSAP